VSEEEWRTPHPAYRDFNPKSRPLRGGERMLICQSSYSAPSIAVRPGERPSSAVVLGNHHGSANWRRTRGVGLCLEDYRLRCGAYLSCW
jgi:hypothetical protein